jgi:hypothetical protein
MPERRSRMRLGLFPLALIGLTRIARKSLVSLFPPPLLSFCRDLVAADHAKQCILGRREPPNEHVLHVRLTKGEKFLLP